MADITFLNAPFLWLLFSIPLMVALHFFLMKYVKRRAVLFANFEALKRVTGSVVLSKNITLLIVRILIILFFIMSAAGMIIWTEGQLSEFNYVLAIDSSSSMLADDFTPNRLEATKETAIGFVDSLDANAKIGVVTFSGVSKIESVLSEDRDAVEKAIKDIPVSSTGGTDITGGIINAVNVLKVENTRSMSIVLLTDGQHTVGSPIEEGIKYALDNKVIVHTIGMATDKGGSFELTQLLSTIDRPTLQRIAENTGGKVFIAGDTAEMQAAFNEIVTLSSKNVPFQTRLLFLVIGIILLFAEWTLLSTRFKALP